MSQVTTSANELAGSLMCGIISIIFIIAGLLLYFFPPKNINSWYGYRTGSSMADQRAWNFSQKYAGRTMALVGFGFLILAFINELPGCQLISETNMWLPVLLLLLSILILFILTEREIKKINRDKIT